MPVRSYEIAILNISGEYGRVLPCRVTLDTEVRGQWKLTAECLGVSTTYPGGDLVDCLNRFRAETERKGYLVVCNGTRRNAWVSGMSRDMGGGLMCYLLELGKSSSPREAVPVLGAATPDDVATLQEQKDFLKQWRESVAREKSR